MQRIPLAERVRPTGLDEFVGQTHLTGINGPLRKYIETGNIPSMIFWGPPGVGKTTLARIVGERLNLPFVQMSAISAGVSDVRKLIAEAKESGKILLFLDEIHRFNKSQQDALLGGVESGQILLIGATTENPSFEVNNALLSRCQVYVLEELSVEELKRMADQAISSDDLLKEKQTQIVDYSALIQFSGGDGRKLLNIIDMIAMQETAPVLIDDDKVKKILQNTRIVYDKAGEEHYNVISAFIKSMRGSDPNAAVYYLARMIEGGENPEFIARRMLILASEDIGNANPTALIMATNALTALQSIGMPEGRIILSQCAIYLACSPKSNASYLAIDTALSLVRKTGHLSVPLHLRNAPTKLMKEMNYGKDYQYAHAHSGNFIEQEFLPDSIQGAKFYEPGNNSRENEMRDYLKKRWKEKYGY
ncbi:MAG: replication-associated recombination protein A [Bacteroidia bacterium]|nr:replication-associated recombination protein A [Bacteroidia bacterium]